jgi:hypothetical protein
VLPDLFAHHWRFSPASRIEGPVMIGKVWVLPARLRVTQET